MDYTVIINGTPYDVHIEGNQAVVNGVAYDIEVQEGASGGTPATAPRPAAPRPAAPRPAAPKPAVKAPAPKPAGKPAPKPAAAAPKPAAAPAPSGDGQKVEAPLPGLVIRIVAQPGTAVKENDVIMVLESMKMETEIYSPAAGTVESIEVKQGDQVQAGTVLAVIS